MERRAEEGGRGQGGGGSDVWGMKVGTPGTKVFEAWSSKRALRITPEGLRTPPSRGARGTTWGVACRADMEGEGE